MKIFRSIWHWIGSLASRLSGRRGRPDPWAVAALSPDFFNNACEITFLSSIETEGRRRGLFNAQALAALDQSSPTEKTQ